MSELPNFFWQVNYFARSGFVGDQLPFWITPLMADNRSDQRHRTYKGGRIRHTGRLPSMDCLIRNLSDRGARLEIDSARVPVDEFDLIILPETLNRKCRVVWRRPKSIGVRFV
jgi:hypothetical protein